MTTQTFRLYCTVYYWHLSCTGSSQPSSWCPLRNWMLLLPCLHLLWILKRWQQLKTILSFSLMSHLIILSLFIPSLFQTLLSALSVMPLMGYHALFHHSSGKLFWSLDIDFEMIACKQWQAALFQFEHTAFLWPLVPLKHTLLVDRLAVMLPLACTVRDHTAGSPPHSS